MGRKESQFELEVFQKFSGAGYGASWLFQLQSASHLDEFVFNLFSRWPSGRLTAGGAL